MKISIFLTASINPSTTFRLKRTDPAVREQDYASVIEKLHQSVKYPIVFCDSSNYKSKKISDLFNKNKLSEIVEYHRKPFPPQYGKGYEEMLLMKHALSQSAVLKQSDFIVKITGRYYIKNLNKIISSIRDDVYVISDFDPNKIYAYSGIFIAKPDFFTKYLFKYDNFINDSKNQPMEMALNLAIKDALADKKTCINFSEVPIIEGYSGTLNVKIDEKDYHSVKLSFTKLRIMFFSKIKKCLKKLEYLFWGKAFFQRFFELLHKISLKGMNFGFSEVTNSGEKYILEMIRAKNKTLFPVIFDIGANKGQYANLIDSIFHGNAKIYSFEPGKITYSELLKNTSQIKNIERYNLGFGSAGKKEYLYYDEAGSGLASVYKRQLEHVNKKFAQKETVRIKKLDDFCEENKIKNIDLLKIDVEGHELEVLKGAKNMLEKKAIKAIQFEFGGANIDSRTYFQDFYYLLKNTYKIYRILQNSLYEIKQYSELQEIFTTVNYFAKLKK